jgi:hypothetical protein
MIAGHIAKQDLQEEHFDRGYRPQLSLPPCVARLLTGLHDRPVGEFVTPTLSELFHVPGLLLYDSIDEREVDILLAARGYLDRERSGRSRGVFGGQHALRLPFGGISFRGRFHA